MISRWTRLAWVLSVTGTTGAIGCGSAAETTPNHTVTDTGIGAVDSGGGFDAGGVDVGTTDLGSADETATTDAATSDAGDETAPTDAATSDAGDETTATDAATSDAGDETTATDAATSDAGDETAATDAGTADAGDETTATDAGTADAGSTDSGVVFQPASHPPMPQVLNNGGGVLTAPVFQSISFSGYDQATDVDAMIDSIGSQPYWAAATSEYGVGTPTTKPPVHLTATASANYTDATIQKYLKSLITAGTVAAANDQMIYVLSFPSTTSITDSAGNKSCVAGGFGGYHGQLRTNSGDYVQYAVIPECEPTSDFPDPAIQQATEAISHELVEAATDPGVNSTGLSWYGVDASFDAWATVLGIGELADACAEIHDSMYQPAGYAYFVQRSWSNASAAASHDPCVPELPGEIYFNAAPVLNDTVQTLDATGRAASTMGVNIAVGASATIEVDLYSEGPLDDWTVSTVDSPQTYPAPSPAHLSFAWDKTTGQNGDKLHLTITLNSIDTSVDGAIFAIRSTSSTGLYHSWFGFVGYH